MNSSHTLQQHQQFNRAAWATHALDYAEDAEVKWRSQDPMWGIWQWPNTEVPLLPSNLTGKRCLEIGCGTAYVSSWMANRGGECFAIDPTPRQSVGGSDRESTIKGVPESGLPCRSVW